MKVSGGTICGHKHQTSTFISTGTNKGSYAVYVCSLPKGHSRPYNRKHFDDVYNVNF